MFIHFLVELKQCSVSANRWLLRSSAPALPRSLAHSLTQTRARSLAGWLPRSLAPPVAHSSDRTNETANATQLDPSQHIPPLAAHFVVACADFHPMQDAREKSHFTIRESKADKSSKLEQTLPKPRVFCQAGRAGGASLPNCQTDRRRDATSRRRFAAPQTLTVSVTAFARESEREPRQEV